MKKNEVIKAYKGFGKDFRCKDFQYEVGKEYEIDGKIKCCERGFHACESPLEVFDYYDMLTSRFAEVEQYGEIDKGDKSTKICSSKIRIKAELKLADIINLGVEWLNGITSRQKNTSKKNYNDSNNGYAQIGSSGNYAKIGSSGYYAQIGSSGNYAQIGSTGKSSVIMAAGYDSSAKAKIGSWITLAEWRFDENIKRYIPVCVKTEQVDGERIKEDTWYKLIGGEFKEVEE